MKPEDARLVHDALAEIRRESERSQVKPFDDLELALHRLYLTEDPRAVARAMGWGTGKRGKSYPREMIVCDYAVREGTRHRSAAATRRSGLPRGLIRLLLGHTDGKTTERYSKHHNDALVALVRRGE